MIIVKIKMFWTIFLCIPGTIIIGALYGEICEEIISWNKVVIITMLATIWALGLNWLINHKIIFNETGVIVKDKISFLFFNFYKRCLTVNWSEIRSVECECVNIKTGEMGFRFYYYISQKLCRTTISSKLTNYKKALRLIVQKLPQDRFDYQAQKKLKKMRIADWPEFEEF